MKSRDQPAIAPSIEGSAIATGFNTIWIGQADPFWGWVLVDMKARRFADNGGLST